MRNGSSGETVRRLQLDLVRLGYHIAADGRFGPRTERAVRAFQKKSRLLVDGIVGPRTRSALLSAVELAGPGVAAGSRPGCRIMLDIQHIGRPSRPDDKGAVSGKLVESELVAGYVERAAARLTSPDCRVTIGGRQPRAGEYRQRIAWANANGVNAYIACHLNAADGEAGYGLVEHLSGGATGSRQLAETLSRELAEEFEMKSSVRELKPGQRGSVCIRGAGMPAVIFEPLFIDNPKHAAILRSDGGERIARVLSDGLEAFMGSR